MESNEVNPDPRAALAGVDAARSWLAGRADSPWWYHPGVGLSFGVAFASASLDWELIPFGVVIGLGVMPFLLTALARRATGVSLAHYGSAPGARGALVAYCVTFLALLAAGIAGQYGLDLPWAMAAAGVLVAVATVALGRRVESALKTALRRRP